MQKTTLSFISVFFLMIITLNVKAQVYNYSQPCTVTIFGNNINMLRTLTVQDVRTVFTYTEFGRPTYEQVVEGYSINAALNWSRVYNYFLFEKQPLPRSPMTVKMKAGNCWLTIRNDPDAKVTARIKVGAGSVGTITYGRYYSIAPGQTLTLPIPLFNQTLFYNFSSINDPLLSVVVSE